MQKLIGLVIVSLMALVLMGSNLPDAGFDGGYFDAGFDSDLLTGGGAGGVDLNTLGQDLIAGEYFDPKDVIDFSSGTKWYFDPAASAGGTGAIDDPFQDLATDIDKIAQYDATYVKQNSGVVEPGDVAVLRDGNHGWIRFLDYYFTDYIGLVGMPGETAVYDYLNIEENELFYIEEFDYSQKARYLRVDAGDMTDSGYDEKPYMFYARTDSNGNGSAYGLIINKCDFSTGTAAEALAWSETEWDSIAVTAVVINNTRRTHIQNCTGTALGAAFIMESSSGKTSDELQLINNSFQWMNGDAFRVARMDSLQIAGNFMRDFIITNDDHVDGVQVWDQVDNVLFEENQIWETTDATRTVFDFGINTFFSLVSSYADGVFDNSVLQNNILYGADWDGIRIGSPENTIVTNNTVIGRSEGETAAVPYIRFQGTPVNSFITNNICSATQDTSGLATISNNSTYTYDWSTAGFAKYTQDGDPGLWDLTLTVSSENVDAGTADNAPLTDYAGTCRPYGGIIDIGAFELDDGGSCGFPALAFSSFDATAAFDSSDNVGMTITAITNNTTKIKPLFWLSTGSAPDSSTVSWIQTEQSDHSGDFDSGIRQATANADSGGIVLNWTAPTSTDLDGVIIEFDQGSGLWTHVTTIGDPAYLTTDTFTHNENDSPVPEPRRGKVSYRAYAFSVVGVDTTTYAVSILDTPFLNQAVEVYTQFHADDGVDVVASGVESEVFVSYYEETGPTGNINSWADLAAIDTDSGTLDGTYTLGTNLSSSSSDYVSGGGSDWIPIGQSTPYFTGSLDGQGYSISDMVVDNTSGFAGLFGQITAGGLVENLALLDVDITNTEATLGTGGIAGQLGLNTTTESIQNCYVTGTISAVNRVGGIAGDAYAGGVWRSYSDVTIVGSGSRIGGIAGFQQAQSRSKVYSCFAVGSVSGTTQVGGAIGYRIDTSTQLENGWFSHVAAPDSAIGDPSSSVDFQVIVGGAAGFITGDESYFYDKTADFYDTGTYTWDFATPIWYEKAGSLPVLRGQQ